MPDIRSRVKELRHVPAQSLIPNGKNWRTHPPSQRAALEGILSEIGFADAILVRETPDGLVICDGHLRSDLMGKAEVPVLVLDLDEAEADKLLLTLDPLGSMANADHDKLLGLLEATSFDSEAVNKMLESLANGERDFMPDLYDQPGNPAEDPGAQIDKAAELQVKWQTERGQVWEIGRHRLMCGDCRDDLLVDDFLMGLEAGVEVVWTDPPYGVNYKGKTADALEIQNDGAADIPELLRDAFIAVNTGLNDGGRIYLAAPPGPLNLTFRTAFVEAGWTFHQGLIWCKDSMVLGHSDYHIQHEDIFYGWRPGKGRVGRGNHEGTRWYGDHAQKSVFHVPRPKRSETHPTMKPPELVMQCLENSSKPGDGVYDPFLGSGTTMVAAEALGRQCFGIEIDPRYVAVTLERMAGLGLEPRLKDK